MRGGVEWVVEAVGVDVDVGRSGRGEERWKGGEVKMRMCVRKQR